VLANQFRIEGLLAVGRQSFIFLAADITSGRRVAVKQPAFDYRKPLLHNSASVSKARQALITEYQVLLSCTTGHLPQPIELIKSSAMIPEAKESPILAKDEIFLVEEHINGTIVTELALKAWPGLTPAAREQHTRTLVKGFITFWTALHSAGWVYGDISADNLILEKGDSRLRVVDAGSAAPAAEEVILPRWTPAFTTPALYEALTQGKPVPGELATALPFLAKVVHFCLTRREPFNGKFPDLEDQALNQCSPGLKAALAAMLLLDEEPGGFPTTMETIGCWLNSPL
jgi:serine/threonine protein kinase